MRRSTRRRQARPPAADAPGARPADARPWRAASVQIIAIFLVAISVRAVHFWAMRDSSIYEVRVGDAWQYDRWAADIADGQWIGNEVFYQTPLYPYALATLFAVLGRDAWLVRIGQAIASSIACVLLARAASRFFDARVGWVTGLMMAFYPPAIFFDGILQKASLDLLLTSLLLWLLSICRSRPTPIAWLALGTATGLFTLNRENAVVLAPVLLAWAAWLCWSMSFSALAVRLGAMLLGGAMVLVPVGLRNLYVGGEFLLTTSQLGPNFYIGNHAGANGRYVPLRPYRGDARFERSDARDLAEQHRGRSLSPAEVSTYWLARTLREIREQPANWLRLIAWKALLTIHSLEIVDAEGVRGHATDSVVLRCLLGAFHFGVLCPLAVAGVWFTRSRLRELWILHALLVAFAGGVILFYVFARYRYPLVPMSMLFAAAGLLAGYDLYRAFDRPARRELFIGIALAGATPLFVIGRWMLP